MPGTLDGAAAPGRSAEDAAMHICPNCAASFPTNEPRCPYCGTLNPQGAERAYMNELEDIRENTDRLDDEVRDDLKTGFARSAKRTLVVIAIFIAAIAAFMLVTTCMDNAFEQREEAEFKEREAFRSDYFDEFDRLYESGDDAKLYAYVWNLEGKPGFDAFYTWSHADYLLAYGYEETLALFEYEVREGLADADDYAWAVCDAAHLADLDNGTRHKADRLSEGEEARMAPYREHGRRFLEDTLQMTEGEVSSFVGECIDDAGDLDERKLRQDARQRLTRLGLS